MCGATGRRLCESGSPVQWNRKKDANNEDEQPSRHRGTVCTTNREPLSTAAHEGNGNDFVGIPRLGADAVNGSRSAARTERPPNRSVGAASASGELAPALGLDTVSIGARRRTIGESA